MANQALGTSPYGTNGSSRFNSMGGARATKKKPDAATVGAVTALFRSRVRPDHADRVASSAAGDRRVRRRARSALSIVGLVAMAAPRSPRCRCFCSASRSCSCNTPSGRGRPHISRWVGSRLVVVDRLRRLGGLSARADCGGVPAVDAGVARQPRVREVALATTVRRRSGGIAVATERLARPFRRVVQCSG